MGDRANVIVQDNGKRVYLYTHWRGYELPRLLQEALIKGRNRWDDGPYLARIIFQEMLGGDTGTTGFGISAELTDNEHDLLVCDTATKHVIFENPEGMVLPKRTVSMADFIKLDLKE